MRAFEEVTGFLDDQGVAYRVLEHEPYSTTEEAGQRAGIRPRQGAKSMLFSSLGEHVLAVVPADQRVSYKKMRKILGTSNLRLASPEEVMDTMGCEVGTCHPFGNLIGARTLVDPSMGDESEIVFNAGYNTRSLFVAYVDYERIVSPELHDIKN